MSFFDEMAGTILGYGPEERRALGLNEAHLADLLNPRGAVPYQCGPATEGSDAAPFPPQPAQAGPTKGV